MWASPIKYLRLDLRAHELLRDVPLYDVSVVDLPGGGDGRSVADIRALESAAAPSRVASAIYGLRHVFGRVFGWEVNDGQLSPLGSWNGLPATVAGIAVT